MKIIAGLGNPGPKYETTRHNIGFLAIDRLIERWKAIGPQTKFSAEVYTCTQEGEKVLLMKPQTFMNVSGKSLAPAMAFYQCNPNDLIVIHDELDLDPFMIRLKTGGGTGGHNGLKSIDESLGKQMNGYHRIRIGVGHPARSRTATRLSPADYVLQPFDDIEIKTLDKVLDQVAEAAEDILQGNILKAMNKFHQKK